MKEAFEKIKERLEEAKKTDVCKGINCCDCDGRYGHKDCDTKLQYLMADKCMEIVSEVEAEFGKDINVLGNGWIPCSERLPEKSGRVLVSYESINDEIAVSETNYDYRRKTFWISPSVIAWMPLPEPYKPEKGDQDGRQADITY